MLGVDSEVITYRIGILSSFQPIKQKKRSFTPERARAIDAEVEKLMGAQYIREVDYPKWLANVVLVAKREGKWRLCINFTNLNKACTKNSYPFLG